MKKTALLPRLSVSSILSYTDEMLHYVNQYVEPSLLDSERYLAVVEAKQRFEKGFNMSRRSNINIKQADANRDRAFLHLKHLVLAGCYSAKEEVQQAGEKVKQLMERLGFTLYRKRYATETADINKLVAQISDEYYQQAIHLLNLQEAIDSLAKANEDFFDSDFEAGIERTERKKITPPSRVRRSFEQAIRGLWEYIDAQAIINPQSGWIQTKKAVELLNDRYSAELKRHYTIIRKRKAKEEGNAEEQPREAKDSSNTPNRV
jgi:5-carboxymethyl-2-hydroxymuconate isomerase